jgi:1-acyl-sn-glycerol-3-phosphate acyltransferase
MVPSGVTPFASHGDAPAATVESATFPAEPAPTDGVLHVLDCVWRTFATGLCFATFGLGQLVLAVTVFPLVVLLVRDPLRRQRVGRRVVQHAFRAFLFMMQATGVLRYRVRGFEKLRQPGTLILANHPSLIDVVFLIAFVPDLDCVVKWPLLKNPFTRYAVMAAGYIPSQLDAQRVMDACAASLAAGGSLLVFPEGTRSEPGQTLRFQRGAANLAIRLGCDMVPVVIKVSEHNLGKRSRWWRIPPQKVSFEFEVKPRLSVAPWLAAGREPAITARELTESLTEYFNGEIGTPSQTWRKN